MPQILKFFTPNCSQENDSPSKSRFGVRQQTLKENKGIATSNMGIATSSKFGMREWTFQRRGRVLLEATGPVEKAGKLHHLPGSFTGIRKGKPPNQGLESSIQGSVIHLVNRVTSLTGNRDISGYGSGWHGSGMPEVGVPT